MPNLTRAALLVVTIAVLALASGCRLVGSGTLDYVPPAERPSKYEGAGCPEPGAWYCEPAATHGSPVTIRIFRAEPGDAWPPPGMLGVWLHADQIPLVDNPYGGGDPSLLILAPLSMQSPVADQRQAQNCSELALTTGRVDLFDFRFPRVRVNADRTLNAWLTVADTPEYRHAWWVLAGEGLITPYSFAIRCGTAPVE
jgi:hypothetical protein